MSKPKIEKPTIVKPTIDREKIKKSVDKMKRRNKRQQQAPAGTSAPDFWGMLDDPDIGDPFGDLEFNPDANLEQTATQEVEVIGEALKRILAEKQERRQKYQLLTDASYYVTVVFQTVEQKLAFMEKAGWDSLDGNFQGMMLNGLELADMMGIELETVYIPKKDPPQAPVALRDQKIIIGGKS